jgi:hypothetical protein
MYVWFNNNTNLFVYVYVSLLVFMPNSAPITLANLFWAVTTTDHILKLATVLFKGILTAIPIAVFPISRRVRKLNFLIFYCCWTIFFIVFQGKCFAFIERSSHLYRALAAVPPWIHYLLNSQSSESSSIFFYDTLVGVCLCGIYLTCKAYRAIKLVRKWKLSVSKLLQSTVRSNHRHFTHYWNVIFLLFLNNSALWGSSFQWTTTERRPYVSHLSRWIQETNLSFM